MTTSFQKSVRKGCARFLARIFLQSHADGQKLATTQLRSQAFTRLGTQLFCEHTAAVQLPEKLPAQLLRQPAAQLAAGCEASSELDPNAGRVRPASRLIHKLHA